MLCQFKKIKTCLGCVTARSLVIVVLGHHFPCLQLAEGLLEIGDGPLSLSNCSIVAPEDLWVVCGLAQQLRRLEDLALCLNALVDVLDLLVELIRLISLNRSDHRRARRRRLTIADRTRSGLRSMRRSSMRVVWTSSTAVSTVVGGKVSGFVCACLVGWTLGRRPLHLSPPPRPPHARPRLQNSHQARRRRI